MVSFIGFLGSSYRGVIYFSASLHDMIYLYSNLDLKINLSNHLVNKLG